LIVQTALDLSINQFHMVVYWGKKTLLLSFAH
jgi:hypothetical protein